MTKTKLASPPAVVGTYAGLLGDLKQRIRTAQVRTAMAGNASMLMLYWEIGSVLAERQRQEGWGSKVLPRLAADLKNELPEEKGFSERNLKRMQRFARDYPELFAIVPQPVALLAVRPAAEIGPPAVAQKVPQAVALLPKASSDSRIWQQAITKLTWAHNVILFEKVKDLPTRLWYARHAFKNGWRRNMLSIQIQSEAHERQGKATTNFSQTLPPPQSDLASQLLKDPYFFDLLTLEKPFHERELETGILRHLQKFLIELGAGFAFVGRQIHMEVGDDDFYLDLVFYHLKLRCFVVIDQKVGQFKAEYAGKMNFYLNAADDRLRHPDDQPSIGLILCQDKNRVVAESSRARPIRRSRTRRARRRPRQYALRGLTKAIGVSEYQLTCALPKKLQSALPSIAQIEAELSASAATASKTKRMGGKRA